MKKTYFFFAAASTLGAFTTHASLITSVPGPDDQGGMKMPMVTITGADNNMDPTTGVISISFNPGSTPVLQSLQQWSPGSWFSDTASWTTDIGSPVGVGGTPAANAGNGDLFNNQYGFMFMAMPMMGEANLPTGKSLAIKLTAASTSLLESYNYVNAQNRWDPVFPTINSQVLWNGSMWHNYFTMPSLAVAGTYSATFEIFIANTAFTGTTGFAQYDATALNATMDNNFTSATVNYSWTVVPEPSTYALLGVGVLVIAAARRKAVRRHSRG
jgi:hypothetical protein